MQCKENQAYGNNSWEQRKFGDVASSFEYGLNAAAKEFDGVNKYLRITDIDDSSHEFSSDDLTSPDTDLSSANGYQLHKGEILFARTGASVGKSFIYRESDGVVYFAGFLIRAKINPEYDAEFIFQNTLGRSYEKYIQVTSQRSGQPGVNAQEYAEYSFLMPKYAEQKKIGNFLHQIDYLITLHQRNPKLSHFATSLLFHHAWEQRKLSSLCDKFTDGDWIEAKDQSDAGVRLIQTGNVGVATFLNKPNNKKWVSSDTFEALHCEEVYEGDILISRLPEPAGRACIVPYIGTKMITAVDCTVARVTENTSNKFLLQYLSSQKYFNEVNTCLAGGTRQRISRSNLANFDIPVPIQQEEQEVIGVFFCHLDHLITLHQRKYDKLINVKKSMLEKMFPKNGSNVPEIRFKGFTEAWEQCKLGDVADIVGGGTPTTSNSDYWNGDIDWYAPAEISTQIYINSSQKKITKQGYENSSAKMLPPGTILFTSRAGIGKTAILGRKGCTNQGFQSIVPHSDKLDSYFLFSRTDELKRYGEIVGAGSTFVEVSGKQMAAMDLMLPSTIGEQQIIGKFFSNLDNLITLHQRKLEKLKNLKKACLEKMFV